ncbi:MAG: hypothetical protein J5833_05380 [Victivallales bacterium]|nr:hypothetical protein [Victivallales bacterium]
MANYTAHYLSGTHWDREWYRTFQEFRLMFIQLVDGLIDNMEKPDSHSYFHFDGQTCVLKDYTELRPEKRERLAKLLKNGRILVGPWFTMPDLFCPGAEALVRNLLTGRRISHEWGVEPMPVAYTCDMFGHPSQMPQIYNGFGYRHCVLGRGTNEFDTPSYFRWQAPDGSEVFTFKLQDWTGYGACGFIRQALIEGDEEEAKKRLDSIIPHEIERCNGTTLCLIDSGDHRPPAPNAEEFMAFVEKHYPDVKVVYSTLPAFFEEAEKTAKDVPIKRHELRSPAKNRYGYLWLIPNCVSSRIHQKLANDESQAMLELKAEPLLTIANIHGIEPVPPIMRNIAWETLLLGHAHDSVCGCSIDQVHRDVMARMDQVRQLARQMANQAFGDLTALCHPLEKEEHEFTMTIANTLPYPRRGPVIAAIDFPYDWPNKFHEGFRSQPLNAFQILDADGNDVKYQIIDVCTDFGERTNYVTLGINKAHEHGQRYLCAIDASVPALGFTSLLVKPAPMLRRAMGSLRTAPFSAANEFLEVTVNPNGTLTLLDKANNTKYDNLLTFEDRSEIGDGWFHGQSASDEIALSTGANAQISVTADGPLAVTFRIQLSMNLPIRYDKHSEHRMPDRADMQIVSFVTLTRGARSIHVKTIVHNNIEDHRLRLLNPSGAVNATTWIAQHPFDYVTRNIELDKETFDWSEAEIAEKPFLDVQAVGDGTHGLAFISGGGMHEGGVADDSCRTLTTTLFRSYRLTVGTPGEHDGLELGDVTLEYALMPYSGDFPAVAAAHAAQELHAPLMTRFTGKIDSGYPEMKGSFEPVQSFAELLSGKLVFSAFKPSEDGSGYILRLWNPADTIATEQIRLWKCPASIQYANLAEQPEGKPDVPDSEIVSVTAAPRKIVTIIIK